MSGEIVQTGRRLSVINRTNSLRRDDYPKGRPMKVPESIPDWFVPRSARQLNSLSFEHRWEVTRRHPVYLRFWEAAAKHHSSPTSIEADIRSGKLAQLYLEGIGAGAPWPSPATPWEQLVGTSFLGAKWIEGAVVPMTYHGMLNAIVLDLPPECLLELGKLFIEAGHRDLNDPANRNAALRILRDFKHSAYQAEVKRAIVGINPYAPSRLIQRSVEEMIGKIKQHLKIRETRRRDDKIEDYLLVWDAREGWWDDHYRAGNEWSLHHISKEFQLAKSTVMNRYRSAFRLIFGRAFSPNLWFHVLGGIKAVSFTGKPSARSGHRPQNDRSAQSVTETRLGVEITKDIAGEQDNDTLLAIDICQLIKRNWTNPRIIEELGLRSAEASSLIDYFRGRLKDELFQVSSHEE